MRINGLDCRGHQVLPLVVFSFLLISLAPNRFVFPVQGLGTNELTEWDPAMAELAILPTIRQRFPNDLDRLTPAVGHVVRQGFARRPLCTPERLQTGALCRRGQKTGPKALNHGLKLSWSDEGVSLNGNASHGFTFAFDPTSLHSKRSQKSPRSPRLGTASVLSPSTAWFSFAPQVFGLVDGVVTPLDCSGPSSNVAWNTFLETPVPDAVTFAGSCSIIYQETMAGTLAYNLTVFDLNKPVSMNIHVQHPIIAGDVSTLFVVSKFVVSSDTAQGTGRLCVRTTQSSGAGLSASCVDQTQTSDWSEVFAPGYLSEATDGTKHRTEGVTSVEWKSPTTDFFLRSDANASSDGGSFTLLLHSDRVDNDIDSINQYKLSGSVNITCAGTPDTQQACFRRFNLHFTSLIDEWVEDYLQAAAKLRMETRLKRSTKATSLISAAALLTGDHLHGDAPRQTKLAALVEGFAFSLAPLQELDHILTIFEHESLHLNVLRLPSRDSAKFFDTGLKEAECMYVRDFPSGWLCPLDSELALRTLCHIGVLHSLQKLLITHEASDSNCRFSSRIHGLIARGSHLVMDLFRHRPASLFFGSRHGSKLCEALAKGIATSHTQCHIVMGCWFLNQPFLESLMNQHCGGDLFPRGALYDAILSEGNRSLGQLIEVLSFISSEERIAVEGAVGFPHANLCPQRESTPLHLPPVTPAANIADADLFKEELGWIQRHLRPIRLNADDRNTERESDLQWAFLDPGRQSLVREDCFWISSNAKYLELLLLPEALQHAEATRIAEKLLDFILALNSVASVEGMCFPSGDQLVAEDVKTTKMLSTGNPNITSSEEIFRTGSTTFRGDLFFLEQRRHDLIRTDQYVLMNHSHVVVIIELRSPEGQTESRQYSLADLCFNPSPTAGRKSCSIEVAEEVIGQYRSRTITATGTLEVAPDVAVMDFNYTVVLSPLDHATRHIVKLRTTKPSSSPDTNIKPFSVLTAEIQMYRHVQHNTTSQPPPILCRSEIDGNTNCDPLKLERVLWDEWAQEFKWYLTNQQGTSSPSPMLLQFPQWSGNAKSTQIAVKPESRETWTGWSVPAFNALQYDSVTFVTHYRCKWVESGDGDTARELCVAAEARFLHSDSKLNLPARDPFKSYPPLKTALAAEVLRDMSRRHPNPFVVSNRLDGVTLSSLASAYLAMNSSGQPVKRRFSNSTPDNTTSSLREEEKSAFLRRRCSKLLHLIHLQLNWFTELLPSSDVENDERLVDLELPSMAFAIVALNTMFGATNEQRYLINLEEAMRALMNMLLPDGRVFRCSHHVSEGSVDCQLSAFFALSRLLATFPFGLSQKAELNKAFLAQVVHRIGLTTVSLRFDENTRKLQLVVEGQGWDSRPTYSRCGLVLRTLVALERAASRFSDEELHQFTPAENARLQALRQVCRQALHEVLIKPTQLPPTSIPSGNPWGEEMLRKLDETGDSADAWARIGLSAEVSETRCMYLISSRYAANTKALRLNGIRSGIELRNERSESRLLLQAYTRYRQMKGNFQSLKRRENAPILRGPRTPPTLTLVGPPLSRSNQKKNPPPLLHSIATLSPFPKIHHPKSLSKAFSQPDETDDYSWKVFLILNVTVVVAAASWLILLQWRKSKGSSK